MINPFTLYSRMVGMQEALMKPLYNKMSTEPHEVLLKKTANVIAGYQPFIEELCNSHIIHAAFKIIKALGGAKQLTEGDFNHFTSYVKMGGIDSMLVMLNSDDMESAFLIELAKLPKGIRNNAHAMLKKARVLHMEFVDNYIYRCYKTSRAPICMLENKIHTDAFIGRLIELSVI